MSRYFAIAVNKLTIEEVITLSDMHRDLKKVISPKSDIYKSIVEQTQYLKSTATLKQRIWHLNTKTTEPPRCCECASSVSWDVDNQQYRRYCSTKCASSSKDTIHKREQTHLDRRGVKYWNQTHISPSALEKLQDKDWLVHQHKTLKQSLVSIGKQLGVHPLLPAQYLNRHGVSGQQNSNAEQELISFIAKKTPEAKVITNTRKIIPPYELDIFIPDKKIAFEFNGQYWHSELAGKDKKYHITKTKMCSDKGIQLIHINEYEWKNNLELVQSRICNILKVSATRIYARNCAIDYDVSIGEANDFLNKNHIQRSSPHSVRIGLRHEGELVSIMTFIKPRFNKKYQWELARFCSKMNYSVVGGASKLFKHFVSSYNPKSVISYSDKRWSAGNLYKSIGFEYGWTSSPNYWYFKNNSDEVFSRIKFQKHKLKSILTDFNPELTEWENMKNNGYNRIWDCGNDVWVWNLG